MKKYLLMLAAGAALLMTGCNNDPKPGTGPGPGPGTDGEVTAKLNGAQYYGEVLAKDTGCYNIELSNGNNVLRLSFVSTVSADPDKAKLQGGTYNKATGEEYTMKTYFFTAEDDKNHDKYGTYYSVNGTETAITDGTVNVTASAGGYTIKAELKAGETEINWQYSGQIEFENLAGEAPIAPVVADQYNAIYNGEYSLSEKPLALVYVMMANSASPYTRCQIAITVPMPEDVDKVAIPTGKFSFTEYANAENQVLAGTIDGGRILYTAVVSTSPTTGYFAGGYLLKSGEVTIDKNADDTYNVHVLADGIKVAADGGKISNGSVEWILEDAAFGDYAMDVVNSASNITEDKTFTNEDLPNTNFTSFVDSTTAPTMILWRFVFSNGDIEFSANDQTQSLNVSGNEGEAVELQFVSDYSEDISVMYGEYTFDWNAAPGSACAALPVLDYFGFSLVADCFSPFGGCWYLDMHADMKGNLAAIEYAGIVPGKESKLRISGDGTNAVFEFEMFDKYGNGISGIRTVAVAEMVEAVKAVAVMPLSIPEVSKTVLPY